MIDGDELMQHIRARQAVRIGARGICIELIPKLIPNDDYNGGWIIRIDRAFVIMDADDVNILDDVDFFLLSYSVDKGKTYHALADLTYYDKITPMYQRVSRHD